MLIEYNLVLEAYLVPRQLGHLHVHVLSLDCCSHILQLILVFVLKRSVDALRANATTLLQFSEFLLLIKKFVSLKV